MDVDFTRVADAIRLLEYCGLQDMRFDEMRFDSVVKYDNAGLVTVTRKENYYKSPFLIGQVGKVKLYNLGHRDETRQTG